MKVAPAAAWLRNIIQQINCVIETGRFRLRTLGVALAVQAALVAGAWWLVPLLALVAWSWNYQDSEAAAVAVGLGLIGTAWTTVGVSLIPLTGNYELTATTWILTALSLATASSWMHRRGSKGI